MSWVRVAGLLAAFGTLTACGPAPAPETTMSTPAPSATPAPTIRELTDSAAQDFVETINFVATDLRCRLTGEPRSAGRGLGYALSAPAPLTVSDSTFTDTVLLEPTTRSAWSDRQNLSVVVPTPLRGRTVTFTAAYNGIEIIDSVGATTGGYAGPSNWPTVFSQVVTKTAYDITCTGNTNLTHTVGVWDGLRLATYPDDGAPPVIIREMSLV
ncbi:hypothetical protein TPB0596_12890 [Tsukamurella pulmonis]|uniref:hypothetical protein n=1 Tax=Tsukamurella pulmonis TaxID=47312 RepID=UPI001EDDD859|nr:hypothetical protein [Tsukamurella pulmonis]BDD81526.1 hypothetical protein TPB0596_12890 [Tsukamurella pulmonis]